MQKTLKPWIIAFALMNLFVWQTGGLNPLSRFAALRAMSLDYSFQIDRYHDWTYDWSQTPDGHYYSNKAPGPVLIAFPLAWVLDRVFPSKDLDEPPRLPFRILISLIFQVIPFVIGMKWLDEILIQKNVSYFSRLAIGWAMLFGNTAATLMNTYFGHAMTACFLLFMGLAFFKKKPYWIGFSFGFALLTDYAVGILVLPLIVCLFGLESQWTLKLKTFFKVLVGALPSAILWIFYHLICFGGPLKISLQFQNPVFVEGASETSKKFWGILQLPPNWEALNGLLFGLERGILWTQPWIFVCIGMIFVLLLKGRLKFHSTLVWFGLIGFLFMLFANSSFNGWHGGEAPGPRYLSPLFPLMAMLLAPYLDGFSKNIKILFMGTVVVSIIYRALVYSGSVLVNRWEPLWKFYLKPLVITPELPPWISLFVFVVLFYWAYRKSNKTV